MTAISRRTFIKGVGAGAAGAAAMNAPAPYGPVEEADAILPALAVVGGAMAAGWLFREADVLGMDSPPAGLTPEALQDQVYQAARTRQSTNASTFVDNGNLVEHIDHAAYSEAKKAAIEELNDDADQSSAQAEGEAVLDEFETRIKENLLKSWNESVEELETLAQAVENHEDIQFDQTTGDVFQAAAADSPESADVMNLETVTEELPNGEDFEINEIHLIVTDSEGTNAEEWWTPIEIGGNFDFEDGNFGPEGVWIWAIEDESNIEYLSIDDWQPLWNDLESAMSDVRDGFILWLDELYGDVESGDLDTEDLLTSRELADMTADQDGFAQAAADLRALNISVNSEREAEVFLPELDATLYGTIAWTEGGTLATGEYDPSTEAGDFYLTYDVAEGSGEWNAFESPIGQRLNFTEEPFESSLYVVETAENESAQLTADDFDEDEFGQGNWSADVSDQLDDDTAAVENVSFFSESDETNFETIRLSQPFEIVNYEDADGESHDSADFSEPSEPQSDDNYISQDEWDQMQENHEEQIAEYEEAAGGGGGLFPDLGTGGILGGGIAIVGVAALLGWLSSN